MKRRRSRPIRFKDDRWLKIGRPKPILITRARFALIKEALGGVSLEIAMEQWVEVTPAANPKEFASSVIFIIANSRLGVIAANPIYHRCLEALRRGKSASAVYRHSGKTGAMVYVWKERARLFKQWRRLTDRHDQVRFCGRLPWIGRMSRYEVAKQLGANIVIPDVHLRKLAALEGLTAWDMCHRLAQQTGYRESTIEAMLTIAFMDGFIDPWDIHCYGWDEGTPRLDFARKCLRIEARPAA